MSPAAALLVRWAAVTAGIASVALPVCVAGSPAARPSGEERPLFFVRPLGHQSHGDAEGRYAPLSMLVAPTIGLLSNTTAAEGVTSASAGGAQYVERSHVLRLLSGRWRYLPTGRAESVVVPPENPTARLQIAESRDWLAAGRVPGRSAAQRAAAERALLAMRALLRPNGAMAAGWSPGWMYSWPRDSSFASAAFAHTGHDAEAYRILRYSAATQRRDGTWDARTELDGSGPPDSRRWQLDANGWVPWATWQWYLTAPPPTRLARLTALYPMIRKAADRAAASLGADGLPPASPDYWEVMTTTTNLGTAAPLLAGLNAATFLAGELDRPQDAARWSGAAGRLSTGISRKFAPLGYQRTVDGQHGRDSAVAFMAPPFNTAPADLPRALDTTYKALLLPNGGLTPGNDPTAPWGANAWTPSTSFFALAWAGTGQQAKAGRVLDWILAKRNPLGELPEKVDRAGRPSSVAPLAWTGSIVVLTLVVLDGEALPAPPRSR
ncbi:glycoside hydrolase family 15 [Streptomyces venezuelae]|uniref:Glycoside hydrolase family 15 n=1 Tax=Streptomyces venezuelae TaxID=54571 RepID=A0A5P2E005_STRVZ|nr:glycoside hydrolase family 15 [Streptomyces venezuelae]QES58209.1 glycoside hydrolase family 15 [Streptomyces venezuelae]